MIKLKSVLASLVLATLPLAHAYAQGAGQLGAGQIWGNPTASPGRGQATNVGPQLDQAFGSTRGAMLERGAAGWGIIVPSATAGLPYVGNGAGADPAYQTLTGAAFGAQSANQVWAGPTTGAAANPTFRALVGADLPAPSAATLGGVQSYAAVAHQWISSISTSGVPSSTQPSFADISGTFGSAQCFIATGASVGCVKPDGTTITVNVNGTITAIGASATSIDAGGATSVSNGNLNGLSCLYETAAGKIAVQPCGAWSNTRLAKVAAYTVASGDAGSTLALGGSAFFAATFNAPSGYTSNFAMLVTNEDTSFGKLIIPQMASSATSFAIGTGSKAFTTTAGLPIQVYSATSSSQRYRVYSLANPANFMSGTVTSYATTTLTINVDTVGGTGTFTDWQIAPEIRLWPGQSRLIFNQNNVWNLDPPRRWKLPAETEICVDAGGSDSNDGLGAGSRCFQHIQFAENVIYQEWDANNFPPDIGLYNGPFNEAVSVQGQVTGYNFTRIRTRAANTWTNSSNCMKVNDGAELILDATFGFSQTWQCNTGNAAATAAIYGHGPMVTDILGAHTWIPGGANDSFVFVDKEGDFTISGSGAGIVLGTGAQSAATFVTCDYHCSGVTVGGTMSYGGLVNIAAYYIAKGGSIINHSANPTGTPGTIGVSVINGLSILRENGLTPPGGAPSLANGGIACTTSC